MTSSLHIFFQQASTSNSFSSLKSIAAQAVATAGLNNPISAPTDYSAESRGEDYLLLRNKCQISQSDILHMKFSEFTCVFTILVKFAIYFLGLP